MSNQLRLFNVPVPSHLHEKLKSKKTKQTLILETFINTTEVKKKIVRSGPVLIPQLVIHPNRISYFNEVVWPDGRPSKKYDSEGNAKNGVKYDHLLTSERSAKGKVSQIARRKMSKSLDYLLLMANPKSATSLLTGRNFKFRIAFVTLTLPSQQVHSDNKIKSLCLNSFLIEIKKFYKVKNYIWRAEKQENGNLHFHIILDKFIPWSELRNRWNRIINKFGYVDRYRDNMQAWHKGGFQVRKELLKYWSKEKQLKAFKRGKTTNWDNPNSTDVHSIKNIHNIKYYLSKYLTKNAEDQLQKEMFTDENKIQKGRIWGCNRDISSPKGCRITLDTNNQTIIEEIIKSSNCSEYQGDYFCVFDISFAELPEFGGNKFFKLFCEYLYDSFGFSYQPGLF